MSAECAGIALETEVVRGVVRTRQGMVAVEVPWDPARPDTAVQQLREQLGDVRGLSLSIGLGFLAMAKPELPPLAGDRARRVLWRDSDRYFPLEGRVAIATDEGGSFAFATSSERLQRWVTAFSAWAPVRGVYAAPHAVAFALRGRTASAEGTLTFTVDADATERGLLSIVHGRLHDARRLPESLAAQTMNGARPLPDSALGVAAGRFAAAVGALGADNASLDAMLLDQPLEASLVRQRQMRLWRSVALFAASLLALGWTADAQRDRLLASVQSRIQSLEADATPAYRAQARLARAGAEFETLAANSAANGAASGDPLSVLAILSRALPASAFVQRVEWDGVEWRVDGSTDNASQVVPRLDAAPQLTNVHPLGASTRFRDGPRMRESFSVAFRVKEAAHGAR